MKMSTTGTKTKRYQYQIEHYDKNESPEVDVTVFRVCCSAHDGTLSCRTEHVRRYKQLFDSTDELLKIRSLQW